MEACKLVLLQCLQMSPPATSFLSKESDKAPTAYTSTLYCKAAVVVYCVNVYSSISLMLFLVQTYALDAMENTSLQNLLRFLIFCNATSKNNLMLCFLLLFSVLDL